MSILIDEQAIVDSLRLVPVERWGEVLSFLDRLRSAETAIETGADLSRSGLVGSWADRDDVGSSQEFAKRLRQRAETQRGATDAGH